MTLSKGKCPAGTANKVAKLHDPCVDITDQIAIVSGDLAAAYFDYPIGSFGPVGPPSQHDPVVRAFKCQFWINHFSVEGKLNYRIRSAGGIIAPWEFPYILAPTRKSKLSCRINDGQVLSDCLGGAARDVTKMEVRRTISNREKKFGCAPGSVQNKIPAPIRVVPAGIRLDQSLTNTSIS